MSANWNCENSVLTVFHCRFKRATKPTCLGRLNGEMKIEVYGHYPGRVQLDSTMRFCQLKGGTRDLTVCQCLIEHLYRQPQVSLNWAEKWTLQSVDPTLNMFTLIGENYLTNWTVDPTLPWTFAVGCQNRLWPDNWKLHPVEPTPNVYNLDSRIRLRSVRRVHEHAAGIYYPERAPRYFSIPWTEESKYNLWILLEQFGILSDNICGPIRT